MRTFGHWPRVRQGTNPAGYVYRAAFRQLFRQCERLSTEAGSGIAPSPEGEAITRSIIARTLDSLPMQERACVALCLQAGELRSPDQDAHRHRLTHD